MDAHTEYVLTLANSIIGVSILAMPYCFKQCGIVPAIIVLLFSNLISRLSCHFLIKSAIISRRRTFEYLAYYIFGRLGKFVIEVGMIGFLLGTCIAFFVVMGDLAPTIVSGITGTDPTSIMRTTILLALAVFCILPLGLLRNVDSLSGVSKATIGFYFCLVGKIVIDAAPHIAWGDWTDKVEFWRPSGVIQCLPIFSMALSCQTQLFEIYQVVHNPSLEKMNNVIRNAVNMCTFVYFFVGFFGYVAFANQHFTGNILLSFRPSVLTNLIKFGFILSVAFSFPLVIFPCRASIHSLIYRQVIPAHETTTDYIPESRFKLLTVIIVLVSLLVGILIPNIEFVLGLVGSSIGIMICILFPVMCFIYVSQKETNERMLAKVVLVVGLCVMVLGTYETLQHFENTQLAPIVKHPYSQKQLQHINRLPDKTSSNVNVNQTKVEVPAKLTDSPGIRHEPPQPVEPLDSSEPKKPENVDVKTSTAASLVEKNQTAIKVEETQKAKDQKNLQSVNVKNDNVDIEAIKKDEQELLLQHNDPHLEEHKILIDKIQKQNEVQEEIVKQQKKIMEALEKQQEEKVKEDKMKAVQQIEEIALKAIEKISGDTKQNQQIVAEIENKVALKVNENEKALAAEKIEDKKVGDLKIEDLKLNVKPNADNITLEKAKLLNVHNNTAPLFANLGQNKIQEKNMVEEKIVPLPLVVHLQQKRANSSTVVAQKNKSLSESIPVKNEDKEKSIGRDLLAYSTIAVQKP